MESELLNLINGLIKKFNLYSSCDKNKKGFFLAIEIMCKRKVSGEFSPVNFCDITFIFSSFKELNEISTLIF